jgi:oligopeptide transport system ATP-binding protein
MSEPVLRVVDLNVQFSVRRGIWGRHVLFDALAGIDLEVRAPEALGVVGESGSGKSTLARVILDLISPNAGRILWDGRNVAQLARAQRRQLRRDLQIVFQNPLASLDPRMTVEEIVAEPLRVHRGDLDHSGRAQAVRQLLKRVGLAQELGSRYPHELSGGQCQRVAIARAMILVPRLLVCDEAVSALDVSIQAQIIDLLRTLKTDHSLALVFISHNLAVVRELCDRVLVLYLGRMMELAPARALYAKPLHPYTRGLIEAVPIPDPELQPLRLTRIMRGEPPSALTPPPGCVFQTRCAHAIEICRREVPAWESAGQGRHVACHRWKELSQAPS